MNAANRMMNRLVLLLSGVLMLLAGAAVVGSAFIGTAAVPADVREVAEAWGASWSAAMRNEVELVGVGSIPVTLLITAAVCVVIAVLLAVFLLTRARGRTTDVLVIDSATGRTIVDRNVVETVLRDPLTARADVLSVHTDAYRVKGTRAVELSVIVRPGARLGEVITAAESAIADWDALLGARVPVLLHLSDRRWRDVFRSRARAQ